MKKVFDQCPASKVCHHTTQKSVISLNIKPAEKVLNVDCGTAFHFLLDSTKDDQMVLSN